MIVCADDQSFRSTSTESFRIQGNEITGDLDSRCNELPSIHTMDCNNDARREIRCNCCVGCSLVSDTFCDREEVLIEIEVDAGFGDGSFAWELRRLTEDGLLALSQSDVPVPTPSPGRPIQGKLRSNQTDLVAAGGSYLNEESIYARICLRHTEWYMVQSTATVGSYEAQGSLTVRLGSERGSPKVIDSDHSVFYVSEMDGFPTNVEESGQEVAASRRLSSVLFVATVYSTILR